ncbi:MAG: glycoside hydrolase family 95 protein [Lachnospiraceae bacterium]|nr:glycoside hydrolase family 95 protein [Lachnospiraceae bacterium]
MMSNSILWYKEPAQFWNEALPLGNGIMGAMIYSDPVNEKIMLNNETLWSGFPRDYHNNEAYSNLTKVRGLILEGKEKEAQNIMEAHMQGRFNESFLPMGEITIGYDKEKSYTGYKRKLDLETAVISSSWTTSSGENRQALCFISQPDNVLIYRISGKSLSLRINLNSSLKNTVFSEDNGLFLCGEAPSHVVPHYWPSDNPIEYGDDSHKHGMNFGIYATVNAGHGDVQIDNGSLLIANSSEVTVSVYTETGFVAYNKYPGTGWNDISKQLIEHCQKVNQHNYDSVLKNHIREYQKYYFANQLVIQEDSIEEIPTNVRVIHYRETKKDNGLIALLYNYGRYLLLSSSRKCNEPANLQGIWNKENRPYWSCNYTSNINLQMNYWPAEVCNLSVCTMPLINLIEQVSRDGKMTANIHYGCHGWTAHHNIDLWRQAIPAGAKEATTGLATSLFWCMAGGWLCRHLWDHYLFSLDVDFLQNEAMPIIIGAVDFYLDWMVLLKDGTYTTIPAFSPENSYYTDNKERCSVSAGSTMDQQIITDTFNYFLEASKICKFENGSQAGQEQDNRINRVKEHLNRMRPILCDDHGRILEWEKERLPFEPGHRHQSPLYGLFPACLINENTPAQFEASRKFLDWKTNNHSSDFGWSLAWVICLYSRLKDKDKVNEKIKMFISGSIYPNLFTLFPPLSKEEKEVFQIDAIFGFTAAIAECLLQSQNGELDVLPCLPACMNSGKVFGLCARGGYVVDIAWKDRMLISLSIMSKSNSIVKIRYREMKKEIKINKNETKTMDNKLKLINRDV